MEIGLSTYSYTWSLGIPGYDYKPVMDIFGLAEKTREYGLHLLQVADNVPLHLMDEITLRSLKEICRKYQIKLEIGAMGLTGENLENYIHIARSMDSGLLRFVIDDKTQNYLPPLEEVKEIIHRWKRELEKHDLILAIENHDRFKAREFASLVRDAGSRNVGICLDCANSLGAGEGIYETVKVLSPHAVNIHFKDISIRRKGHKMGFDVDGVPFGNGIIPLQWVISRLPGKCRTGILELWMPPCEDPSESFKKENEWVKTSLEYLKTQLK